MKKTNLKKGSRSPIGKEGKKPAEGTSRRVASLPRSTCEPAVAAGNRQAELEIQNEQLRNAQDKLRLSEEKNRQLFESSRDALMTLEPPLWTFTRANRATLGLFGVANEAAFIALRPWDTSPEQQPDGRLSADKAQEMIATAMQEGSHSFEWIHRRLDGSCFAADVLLTRMEIGDHVSLQATVRDITERKRAETALRKSEAVLADILEHVPVGIGLMDLQGRLTISNSLLRRFVTDIIPSRDALNSPRWRSWSADGRLLDQSEWPGSRALRGERVSPGLDFLYTSVDGREIWTRVSAVPFHSESGYITGAITVVQDIDVQKRTEETIKASEVLHRQILQTAMDGFWLVDLEGRLMEVNEAYCRMSGYHEQELLNKSIADIEAVETPDGVAAHIRRIGEQGWDRFETVHRRKDGSTFNVEISVQFAHSEGGHISAFIRDITDRLKAEDDLIKAAAEWEATFDSMTEGVSIHGADYTIINANQALCDMMGKQKQDLIGANCYRIFHGKNTPLEGCPLERSIKTRGKERAELFEPSLNKWLDVSTSPIPDESGKSPIIVHVIRDISDRKQTEQALIESEERLRIRSRELEEMNSALKVLLKQREQDQRDLEEKVHTNVKHLVLPYVEILKKRKSGEDAAYLNIIESNLHNVISSFATTIAGKFSRLTPQELLVATMIKDGMSNKEIADTLHASIYTINAHRRNIRKKLNLTKDKTNLRTYLLGA